MKIAAHLVLFFLLSVGPGGGTVGSEYFTVRYGPGEEGLARAVLSAAMKARSHIEAELGIASDGHVMVLLAPGGKDGFQAAQPGETRVPEWAIGTAYPQGRTIVLRRPDNLNFRFEELDAVVTHEYTHIAVGAFLGDRHLPRWFDEGLAGLMAGERSFTDSATIGYAALTNSIIPLKKLDYSWPESGVQADLAYAESEDFLSWIRAEYGRDSIAKILKKYKETNDLDKTLTAITGNPLQYLEGRWVERIARKYKWISILTGGFTLWFIATILFLIGYARKKWRGKAKMKEWELEEKIGYGFNATSTTADYYNSDEDDLPPPPSLH